MIRVRVEARELPRRSVVFVSDQRAAPGGPNMHRIIDSRFVLAVRDLPASTRFYIDVLGFRRDFGDGSDGWSFLSRDAFKVMLGECPDEKPASELGDHSYVAYLIVEGVDELHQELAARGAPLISEPTDEPWGLREFGIRTPDGHRIRFGQPIVSHADVR
jgi:catechol 2,3-dioxygenase-like lactoylglutathione lyase family enzyme